VNKYKKCCKFLLVETFCVLYSLTHCI